MKAPDELRFLLPIFCLSVHLSLCVTDRDPPEYWKGDCWPEGSWMPSYSKNGVPVCQWNVTVRAIRCHGMSHYLANGHRSCTGEDYNVWGSTCSHECTPGYKLMGSSTITCKNNSRWNSSAPSCQEMCSWRKSHCWPGDCESGLSQNCVCRDGFRRALGFAKTCEISTPPDLHTCHISLTDIYGTRKTTGSTDNQTTCSSQQGEPLNIIPSAMHFVMRANLNLTVGHLAPYVKNSSVGVVDAKLMLKVVDLQGKSNIVHQMQLNGPPHCQRNVNYTQPVTKGSMYECIGTVPLPGFHITDGESLCVVMEASAGGYYTLQDEAGRSKATVSYTPITSSSTVCFLYDPTKPTHIESIGNLLRLDSRLTRRSEVVVYVDGWEDPVPTGGTSRSASGIAKYRIEVHRVYPGTTLTVQVNALDVNTVEWKPNLNSGPYDLAVTLPEEGAARLYAIILEVHDEAGNVAYARRLVLYDITSAVELNISVSVQVVSADVRTNWKWQTNISRELCVDWKGRFYNNEMYHNNLLMPVNPDTGRQIEGEYDQQSGILPVSGTDNVNGIVKFEMAWSHDDSVQSPFEEMVSVHTQSACLNLTLKDGDLYTVTVRATDIMGNQKEDNVSVSVDHTDPSVSITGLRGRFGRDGLYVHNTTNLSTMKLVVDASDPHSGIKTLQWTVGTRDLADDVGSGAIGVHRLYNGEDCQGRNSCYCPSVGVCEIHRYIITFFSLRETNAYLVEDNRAYYITVTATNHASLQTTERIDILVDESPPTVGVVLEGLSDDDQAEMDFTSSHVVHVRWHGFLDHESGILLYRVVLADRCLTNEDVDVAVNATELQDGNMTTLVFPSKGLYFTNVVAYNGAMEPSSAGCSDGIIFDTNEDACPSGHYFNIIGSHYNCEPCPMNTYVETSNQMACKTCPDNLVTLAKGSQNLAECKAPEGTNVTVNVELKYVLVEVCTVTLADSVRTRLTAKVIDLNSDMPTLCSDVTCQNVRVTASCEGPLSKSVVAVTSFSDLPGTVTSKSGGVTMTTKDMLLTKAVQEGVFDLPSLEAELVKNDVVVSMSKSCRDGFKTINGVCKPSGETPTMAGQHLGGIVGGCIGVVALVVLAVVVVKLIRQRQPGAYTKSDPQPPEHPYSGLSPPQGVPSIMNNAVNAHRQNPAFDGALDTSSDYDYIGQLTFENGNNVTPEDVTHNPSAAPQTPPASCRPRDQYLMPCPSVHGLASKVSTPPDAPVHGSTSSERSETQVKRLPPVPPKPRNRKPALPGADAVRTFPQPDDVMERPKRLTSHAQQCGKSIPDPVPHVAKSRRGYITPRPDLDEQVHDATHAVMTSQGPFILRAEGPKGIIPRRQNLGQYVQGPLRLGCDYYIPPADYEI